MMASSDERIHKHDGRGVLLTHNDADFTLRSKPLVEPHDVHMVKVEEEVTYTTVCLDNALRLPFLDQAHKLFSADSIKSKDCPLSFSSLGVPCDKLGKQGRAVIKRASRIVEKGTSSYKPILSEKAIAKIKSIKKVAVADNCPNNDIKRFFETFGSHFIQGSLEDISSFEWAVIAESDCDADILFEIADEVFQTCQLPHDLEGSNSGMRYDINSFMDTSDWNRRKTKVSNLCKLRVMHNNRMEQNMTFQKWQQVTSQKRSEQIRLMMDKTDSVKPVWDLIKESSDQFQRADCLAELFEATWKKIVDETKHSEKEATSIPVTIESTSAAVDLETKWKNLQKDTGIEIYYPCKLSLHKVMALDCHSAKPSSWNEIALDMVKRLIMIDNRFLEKPFLDYIDEMEHQGYAQQKIVYPHPMDVMLLLFHASDFMLRQVLAKKLFMCRKAIPFIIPTENEQLQIMMWPLRPIVLEWKKSDKAMEESLTAHPITRISFLKFGTSAFSKSNLFNDILSANQHKVFSTRESRLIGAKRIISNGMVEMTHYSPAGKEDDVFSEPIMLFNLRGDAIEFTWQEDILTKLSHVVVFIYDIRNISDKECLEKLKSTSTSSSIIVLLTNVTSLTGDYLDKVLDDADDFIKKEKLKQVKMIHGFDDEGLNKNQMLIVHALQKAINEALPQVQINSMEDALQQGSHKALIDESSHKDCMEGKKFAEEFVTKMRTVPKENVKETLLPLQGKVCKEMGFLLRRQHRDRNQDEKEKMKNKIEALRKRQNAKFKPEMSFVKQYFLDPQIDDQTRLFFTKWVKMGLDNDCRSNLPQLQADYNLKWNKLMKAKKSKNLFTIDDAQKACHIAEEKVAAAGLGLEHLMRECGQIYEVGTYTQHQRKLPVVAGSLLMAGYPLEIMDGDNGFIPMQWVTEVLNVVSSKVGKDKKVFVLSVLGIQSSGKSTLLNSMFGLEFAVSAGRCTRGIYAQMLPVNKEKSPDLPFDYLLVLDSEGLRAPELALKKFEHDNELATLVIGLADLTLINLKGENTAEIQDVLQIVVHAFLRMQRADYTTKRHCMFIHQNVSAVNVDGKMRHGQQKLQEGLDEMTVQAAEALGLEMRFTSFQDVISFERDKDTLYFSDLWVGDPPMATVNKNYSEKCVVVQKQILDQISSNSSVCITIADFIIRLKDLWEGVLADDFVFSFRNSLAAKAYISLEQQCAKQRRLIESSLLGWINKECRIQIEKCNTVEELQDCFNIMLHELQTLNEDKVKEGIERLHKFVENHPQRDILEQWRTDKLLTFTTVVELDTSQLRQLIEEMKERHMVDLTQQAQQQHHKQEIMKNAIGLAEQIRGEQPTEAVLKQTFESMWKIWSKDIRPKKEKKGPTIISILHLILADMFSSGADSKFLSAAMEIHTPGKRHLEVPTLAKHDVEIKNKSWLIALKKWWSNKSFMDAHGEIVKNIIKNTQTIDGIVSEGRKFNKTHGREVLQSIFDQFDAVNSRHDDGAMLTFKPSAKAKVCLVVCDYAAEQFEKMNEEFESLHGVKAKTEAYKKKVFMMFQDKVKQLTSEKNAAEYLCEAICPNIEKIVNNDISRKVVDLILQEIGHVKFHLMLTIMQSIVETEDFSSAKSYVTDAHTFASQWIQNHIESTLIFASGKSEKRYIGITSQHVEKIITCIREGVTKASNEDGTNLIRWINTFCKHAQQEVSITPSELKDLENYAITNFVTFGQLLEKRLLDLNTEIYGKLAKVTKENVKWNGPNPFVEAASKLWGCKEQCPFCAEPCQRSQKDHKAEHLCVQHRPSGINGVHNTKSLELVTRTCNLSVAGDLTYDFSPVTGKTKDYHPYKEYKEFYPQWDIAPDDAGDAAKYWKWLFCTFEKQIQEWRSGSKLEIPESWHNVTKKQALDSLRL